MCYYDLISLQVKKPMGGKLSLYVITYVVKWLVCHSMTIGNLIRFNCCVLLIEFIMIVDLKLADIFKFNFSSDLKRNWNQILGATEISRSSTKWISRDWWRSIQKAVMVTDAEHAFLCDLFWIRDTINLYSTCLIWNDFVD